MLTQQLIELLPQHTYLHEVDHQDELPLSCLGHFIQTNGNDSACEHLWSEVLDDWDTSYSIEYYVNNALEALAKVLKMSQSQLTELLDSESDDWHEQLRYAIEDRNESLPWEDLAKNRGNVVMRLMMHSNYDCINSSQCEGKQLDLDESYLADILRVLRINPIDYVQFVSNHREGYDFINVKDVYRGQPLATPEAVFVEHEELPIGPALLTIVFTLPAIDIMDYVGLIKVPKGARIGFYNWFSGAGSMFESVLEDDFVIDLANQAELYSEPTWDLAIDELKHSKPGSYGNYNLDEIYGCSFEYWDIEGQVLHRMRELFAA